MEGLSVNDLHVEVNGKEIVKGTTLQVGKGEVVALMGPNGSGKSTLAHALMGHPHYSITKGKVMLNSEDITSLPVDERARKGLFLSFQYPQEIQGVTIANFLRTAKSSITGSKIGVSDFMQLLKEKMSLLKIDHSFSMRYLNQGFSGGEKKKAEILQLAVLEPKIAILDETDSGLDIDALKTVAEGLQQIRNENMGILIITHYQRILNHIKPGRIYIILDGRIAKSGGAGLANHLEEFGYDWLNNDDRKTEKGN